VLIERDVADVNGRFRLAAKVFPLAGPVQSYQIRYVDALQYNKQMAEPDSNSIVQI
jgi:hypothetical protein